MKTKVFGLFLLLSFINLLLSLINSVYAQELSLKGYIWDDHNHRYLPVTVYSIIDSQKKLLGSSVQLDVFEHQYQVSVPLNTDSLLFEMSGYSSICLPVYFHGTFEKKSAGASISIEMPTEGEDISQRIYNLLPQPEEGTVLDNEFKLQFFHGDRQGYTGNLSPILSKTSFILPRNIYKANAKYKLTITSPEGELLTQNEFLPKPGINFVDANIYPQEKTTVQKTGKELPGSTPAAEAEHRILPLPIQNTRVMHEYPYGIPSIFFDQSKYELKTRGRHTLDSLLDYLNHKAGSKIAVKGFTDQIGDPALNTTLARYRAQVVANYLTGKGLSPHRINIQWDQTHNAQILTDTGLSRYRKVTITEFD